MMKRWRFRFVLLGVALYLYMGDLFGPIAAIQIIF
jgi:hypothetical protein